MLNFLNRFKKLTNCGTSQLYLRKMIFTLVLFVNLGPALSSASYNFSKFCSDDKTTTGYGQFVYDVTRQVHDNASYQEERFCRNIWNTTEQQICEHAYFRLDSKMFNYDPAFAVISKYFETPWNRTTVPAIGFIFRTDDTCQFQQYLANPKEVTLRYHPNAVIISLLDFGQSCDDFCDRLEPNVDDVPGSSGPNFLRIGMEVSERLLDCLVNKCSLQFSWWQVTVVRIEVPTVSSNLSYGYFSMRMAKILDDKWPVVNVYNSNFEFYIRLSLPQSSQDIVENEQLYRAYIGLYAFAMKADPRAQFILDTFSETSIIRVNSTANWISSHVYPHLHEHSVQTTCHLSKLQTAVASTFENVVFGTYAEQSEIPQLFTSKCNNEGGDNRSLAVNTSVWLSTEYMAWNLLQMVRNGSTDLSFKTLYVDNMPFFDTQVNITSLWNLAAELNISLGCSQAFSTYFLNGYNSSVALQSNRSCDAWFKNEPLLYINWNNFIPVEYSEYWKIAIMLDKSLEFRRKFQETYQDGKVHLQLNIMDIDVVIDDGKFELNLFCSSYLTSIKETKDVILIWSHVHNFPVTLGPIMDEPGASGFWYNVDTLADLNRTISDFYLLVRRNVPKMPIGMALIPPTHPCIHLTPPLSVAIGDKAVSRIYSGIRLDLNFVGERELSANELQVLLVFAFQRFNAVEVTGIGNHTKPIKDALASNLKTALNPRSVEAGTLGLYVELNDTSLIESNMVTLSSTEFHITGFHFSGWKLQDKKSQDRLHQILNRYYQTEDIPIHFDFGITINNCIEEINSNLSELKSLPYLKLVKYIVCVKYAIIPSNQYPADLQLYLDTQFYIQQYFQAKLGVDTFFRLSFRLRNDTAKDDRTEISNYLRFLNDTNQYSAGYNVKYFMGDAFSNTDDNLRSWWTTSDNKDLSNASKYTEQESNYYGLPTNLRYKIPPLNAATINKNLSLIFGLAGGLVLSFAVLCSLWEYNRRLRRMILTKEEVNAFRNGEEISQSEESVDAQSVQVRTVKTLGFDTRFEIPKTSLQLGDEIGQGNFGLVYNGTYNQTTEVAIKTQKPDCPKESFKSMLAEVKVLCYIGNHPNVISFIGAYTKEIGRGFIYIVTEFCERGCLHKYLKQQKPRQERVERQVTNSDYVGYVDTTPLISNNETNESPQLDMNELHRFAYEIASGMEYIASRKVVHSDLSTRNILLDGSMTCKIGDFGLSRKLYERTEYIKKGEEALPWRWMAPESLQNMEFTSKSDVWSFGVTLWEIFSFGDVPYPGITWSPDFSLKLLEGLRMSKPQHAPDSLYDKMLECWAVPTEQRPSFTVLTSYLENFVHI